MYLMS